ncbi:MAG: nucleotidyltransferase family protein [Rhodomicrobium sp.]
MSRKLKAIAVLLGAGLSRRMGARNKLLIEVNREALVRRTAKVYLAAGVEVRVVLGHEAASVRAVLDDLPVTYAYNPDYVEGQQTSVRVGVDSIEPGYDAVLIALADQAALTPDDVVDLLNAFAADGASRILVPHYKDSRGNPVIFPAGLLEEMRTKGESPGRAFIDNNPELTSRYEAPNDHVLIDIDTADDLIAFEQAMSQKSQR